MAPSQTDIFLTSKEDKQLANQLKFLNSKIGGRNNWTFSEPFDFPILGDDERTSWQILVLLKVETLVSCQINPFYFKRILRNLTASTFNQTLSYPSPYEVRSLLMFCQGHSSWHQVQIQQGWEVHFGFSKGWEARIVVVSSFSSWHAWWQQLYSCSNSNSNGSK